MPKKGPNPKSLEKIRDILKQNPQGLWIRELARKTKLDKSLISRYLNKYLTDKIEEVYLVKKNLIKIVRLKND